MFSDENKNPFPLIEYFNIFSFNDFSLELNNENKRAVFEMTMRDPSPEMFQKIKEKKRKEVDITI